MNKNKRFFKIQIGLCGSGCIISTIMALRGISLFLANNSDGFEIAATFYWMGAAILNSFITLRYLSEFKKILKKDDKKTEELNIDKITNRWENRDGKMPYRCGECGRFSTKNYTKCPSCHSTMLNGDASWDKRGWDG